MIVNKELWINYLLLEPILYVWAEFAFGDAEIQFLFLLSFMYSKLEFCISIGCFVLELKFIGCIQVEIGLLDPVPMKGKWKSLG